jgi:hypothetical protein
MGYFGRNWISVEQGSQWAKIWRESGQNVLAAGSKGLHGLILSTKVVLSRSNALSLTDRVHTAGGLLLFGHHSKVPIEQTGVTGVNACNFALVPSPTAACTAPAPRGAHHLPHAAAGCQPCSRFSAAGLFRPTPSGHSHRLNCAPSVVHSCSLARTRTRRRRALYTAARLHAHAHAAVVPTLPCPSRALRLF